MSTYDDDLPTQQEDLLLQQIVDSVEQHERIQALIQVKATILRDT